MKKHKRLNRERETVSKMIALYCKSNHSPENSQLCEDCLSLEAYAHQRIEKCPFGEGKSICAKCSIHCYLPDRREEIRQVMRFSGPRMLIHHPTLAVCHLINGLQNNKQ